MKRSLLFVLSMLIIFVMVLSACAPAAQAPTEVVVTEPPAEPPAQPVVTEPPATEPPKVEPTPTLAPPAMEEAVNIAFWHSMGGDLGGIAIPQMANDFNASQSKC